MRTLLALLTICFAPMALSADYAREKRWADEVVPGLVVGDAVYLQTANGHQFLGLYTESDKADAAIILVHGIGVHPDMGLIGMLRSRLADDGYTTLSIQMPVLAADASGKDYLPEFPEAGERISKAVQYLQGKNFKKIALVSHSLGSRMSSQYLKKNPAVPLFAWVSLSITDDTMESLGALKFPILDLYGENDLPQVLSNTGARAKTINKLKGSMQIMISGTNHFFEDRDDDLVNEVKKFLDNLP